MATLTIDLSGRTGLAQTFAGDINETSANQNRRYIGGEGQMADGIYNPIRIDGYLTPANNKYADLTGTINDEIIAREYSSSNDTLYLAQNGTRLSEVNGLDDTSVTSTVVLPGQSAFRDIEMYEMNGTEALLYTYLYSDSSEGDQASLYLGFKSVDTDKGMHQIESTVLESLGESTTANQQITSSTSSALAQKFRTQDFNTQGTYDVSGIRVALNMPFVGTTQLWTLRIGIQTESASAPSGTYVTNGYVDIDAADLPVGHYDYVYATFSATVSLSANTNYYIVIEPVTFGDLGANEGVYWLSSFDSSSLYTTGEIYKEEDATWVQASFNSESFDFALVLNQYNYIGNTEETITTDVGNITIGAAANGYQGANTTVSATQSTSGALNPVILAGVSVGSGTDSLTGVTCDGAAMTFQNKVQVSGGNYIYLYSITGIAEGSHTITATASGSTAMTLLTSAYYGVDQTTPLSTEASNSGGSNETSFSFSVAGYSSTVPTLPFVLGINENTNGNTGITADSPFVERSESASNQFVKWFDTDAPVISIANQSVVLRITSGTGVKFAAIRGRIIGVTVSTVTDIVPPIIEGDGISFLQKADNGSMYWFTNSRVHKFNGGSSGGAAGTLATDVLSFPDYITCVDAVDTNSVMYIAVQSTETTSPDYRTFSANVMGVYLWDRRSTADGMRDFLPIYGARSIKKIFVTPYGELRVITIGEDKFTEVRGPVNGKLNVLFRLGLSSYPVRRDGVDVLNNLTTWLGADGIIYALGKLHGSSQESLYKIGTVNGELAGALTAGVIATGNDNNAAASQQGVYLTWLDGSTKVVSKWYPHATGTVNSVAQTGNEGNVYSLVKFLPTLSTIQNLDIVCLPNGAADDTTAVATLKLYVNQSTTPWKTKTITRHEISKGYVSVELNKPYVTSVQAEIEWSTSQTMGSNDFAPAYLLMEYEPTTTRG